MGRGTKRPLNVCNACGNTWYPRGKDLSNKCPHCGSGDVKISMAGLYMALAAFGVVAVVWMFSAGSGSSSVWDAPPRPIQQAGFMEPGGLPALEPQPDMAAPSKHRKHRLRHHKPE